MTYIRRLVRGDNVYFYEVTSYRAKETGNVRQRSEYKRTEIIKDNTVTVRKPRNRITARKVLDSAPYIIYKVRRGFWHTGFIHFSTGWLDQYEGGCQEYNYPCSKIHDGFIWLH